MKKRFIVLFVLGFFTFSTFAQDKQLSLIDVMTNPAVYPKRLRNAQWIPSTDKMSYIKENALVFYAPNSKQKEQSYDLKKLNESLSTVCSEELSYFPSVEWIDNANILLDVEEQLIKVNVQTNKAERLTTYPENPENIERCDVNYSFAFTRKNNLFIFNKGKEISVTNESDPNIVSGQTVSRVEFGIEKGSFWSPNGNYLAFYQKDETNVTNYPLVDITARIATVENTKYPMAGMESQYVYLGVYNLKTKTTIYLETGKEIEHYLASVTWSPDEKYIYLAILNRDQNHLKLNKYDAQTGKLIKTLFEEKNDKYVKPEFPLYFPDNDPSKFIWFSERDGFQHMYLYSSEGKLLKQLTSGEWMVTNFLGFYDSNTEVCFMATKESPIESHAYAVNMKSTKVQKLTKEEGVHYVEISKSGEYIIDTYSNIDVAREVVVLDRKQRNLNTLLENHNPLEGYNLEKTEVFTIKAEDGTDLYCSLTKPENFDPNKKYPAIVYVYGGPHAQLVTNSWLGGGNLFLNYLAQEGYVVFTLDNRGSANRGFEFESAIHRNAGIVEVQDQMQGIAYLESLGYVDMERVGVDGWSYGGFMTISLMLKNPGVFKVGCAGGPVIDWKWYEVMYGERYMDTPQQNEEGYENASLLNYADKLEGKLLIVHGTEDPTVVWQNSLAFIEECINEGKLVDYFVYPGHGHNVGGMDRLHLYRKIEQYFKENL
jgi:dipeptidyl-peptidase 4